MKSEVGLFTVRVLWNLPTLERVRGGGTGLLCFQALVAHAKPAAGAHRTALAEAEGAR